MIKPYICTKQTNNGILNKKYIKNSKSIIKYGTNWKKKQRKTYKDLLV